MNKTSRVSLTVGVVAIVGIAAAVLGNYLLPGGLFQSSLINPVDKGVPIGTGYTSAAGYNFTFNPDLTVDDGSITANASLQQYLGGASNVSNKNGSDNFPDAWTDNPDAYFAYGIQPGTPEWPVNKMQTNPINGAKRLLMDARDKAVHASIRQISFLPADKIQKGDKFVLRAWVSSANNADQDTQVRLSLGHNNCLACWPKGYVKLVDSSTDWINVASGPARMITTPVLTITGDEVMTWDAAQGRLMLIPSKFPAGTTSYGGVEGNLFSQLNVKPGHAAYVERIEVVKVADEDSNILANGDFPASNEGYVRTIQPNLPAGAPKYLPAGWSSQAMSNPVLDCGVGAAVTNTGAGIKIDSGSRGCIYQYKVQGDWNSALKKYVSDVKVGDEYVTKATVQGANGADAYVAVSASHITEPDIATMKNFDFDHVQVWGTAKKDTPTIITTTPLKVTSEDATGLHVLGASVMVEGPASSVLVTKVEMIKCTRDANGDYEQNDCKSNSGTSNIRNAQMTIDQGLPYNGVYMLNTVAGDGRSDSWNIQCKTPTQEDANTANAITITEKGAKIQVPDNADYCDVYQMVNKPMVKDDTYVGVTKVLVENDQKYSQLNYTQIGHNSPWSSNDRSAMEYTPQYGNRTINLGNNLYEFVTQRLQIKNPNLMPGQHTFWNYRQAISYRISRTTDVGVPNHALTIMNMDIFHCDTLDKSSDKFKNYCVQDILPVNNQVSTNPSLFDSIGLIQGAVKGDIIPDGWSIVSLTDANKDHIKRVNPSNTLKNVFQISNQDINPSALLALSQDMKVADIVGKKFMAVAQLRGSGDSSIEAIMRLSHNGTKQYVDGANLIGSRSFSTMVNDLSQFKTYTTPILNVTQPTEAGQAGDLRLQIHPGHNYDGLDIQSAKVIEIKDGDLETIKGKLQLKPTLNGSFENDNGTDYGLSLTNKGVADRVPDGWTITGCAAGSGVTSEDKVDGTNSLKLTQDGTGICMIQQPSSAPIVQGDLYVLSAKVKNIGNDDGVFQMRWVHNYGNELSETKPDEAYTVTSVPKNSDWMTVKYASKMKIMNPDSPYDRTSMTELFNITNTSGASTSTTAVAPLLVDDVKLTNCTQNPTAPECVNTPDQNLAPTNQQLLYNTNLQVDNGQLPLTDKDKLIINNNKTEKDGMPDGWFIDGWAGPNSAVKSSYENVQDINFSTGETVTKKYFKIDTTAVPSSQTPLTQFIQTRYVPTQKGDKFRAVAMVRTASENNTPVKVQMNLEHNPYVVPRPAADFTGGTVVAGNTSTRLETGILTITTDDKIPGVNGWDRGNLSVGIYLERNVKVYIESIHLYRVPNDYSAPVVNKDFSVDDGSIYVTETGNTVAYDQKPDGWHSECAVEGLPFASNSNTLYAKNTLPFEETIYLTAFPELQDVIGEGKQWNTAAEHYATTGMKKNMLADSKYKAAFNQLAPNYNETAYLLAFDDVAKNVGPGKSLPSGIHHYMIAGRSDVENRLARPEYQSQLALMGSADKGIFFHNYPYARCEISSKNAVETVKGDKYVARMTVKNVSKIPAKLQMSLSNLGIFNASSVPETGTVGVDTTIPSGKQVMIKSGVLTMEKPEGAKAADLSLLKVQLSSLQAGTAVEVSDVKLVNCTKEPANEACLAPENQDLLGKGNQLLVNNMFIADDGSVPQNKIALKMDRVPNNGIADGWEYDAAKVTRTTFETQPVLKVDATQKTLQVKQTLKRDAKNKKYQAVIVARTANPGNIPSTFIAQVYNNPYAPAPYSEYLTGGGQSFTVDSQFRTFTTSVLSVTQDDKSPGLTSGYDNLFFNIYVPAGNMIYVQKAQLIELAEDEASVAKNSSFEKDNGTVYPSAGAANGAAEDNIPDGWTVSSANGISIVQNPVHSGQNALSITTEPTQGGKGITQSTMTPTVVGDKYVAVAYVHSANPATVGIKLEHNHFSTKNDRSSPVTHTLTASGSTWTKLISQQMTISKPDSATGENLKVSIAVLSPNSTVVVDDVAVINCTKNPTTPECTVATQQNPILTNGAFELDNGTVSIEGLGDSAVNGIPDTWRRNCGGNGTISSTAGKTGSGILLSNTEGGHCIYQYTNVQPMKDHIYVATADVKAVSNNIYTLNFDLYHNPNTAAEFAETVRGTADITQNWKTVSSGPLKIAKPDATPQDLPYNIYEKFGVILQVKEAGANVVFDNVAITDCTLTPNASACTQALSTVTAEKSATMGDSMAVKGQTLQRVGSVKVNAGVNAATLQSLKLNIPSTAAGFSNFKLSSTGSTMVSGQSGTGTVLFNFGTNTAANLAKNQSNVFDIYADIAANATASGSVLQLSVAQNGIAYIDTAFNKSLITALPEVLLQKIQLNTTAPVVAGSVAVTKNALVADQSINRNGESQKIGSFILKANGENYKIESISVKINGTNGLSNMYLTSSGQLLGSTVVSPATTNLYGFANAPLYIAKDASATVDIYATIAASSNLTSVQASLDVNSVAAKNDVSAVTTAPAAATALQTMTLSGALLPSAPATSTPVVTNPPVVYAGVGGVSGGASLGQLPSGTGTGGGTSAIVCPPSCEPAIVPKDVLSTHFAYNAVKYLSARGILKGYPDNTFRVQNAINRAEFVKIVSNGFKLTTTDKSSALPFKDIRVSDWFYTTLRTVYKVGLVKGYASGDFLPAKNIQRDEAVKIMALADAAAVLKAKTPSLSDADATVQAEALITTQWNTWKASHSTYTYVQFTDAGVNTWYAKYLLYAVNKGYISGRTVNGVRVFAPADQITRGEAAVLIARIIDANKLTYPAEKKADNTFTVKFPE